jgi:ketosteroid isomerase-like protein
VAAEGAARFAGGIPDGGSYDGIDGVRRYMSAFLEPWDTLTIAAKSFESVGDKVLVNVRQAGTGQGSGVPVKLDYFQLWTFRDGKVVRLEILLGEEPARAGLAD